MQEKLKNLLEKINIDDNSLSYFNEGFLEKISCNKQKDDYCFYININNILPLDIYLTFFNLLKKTFQKDNNISLVLTANNKDNTYIKDYFKYIIEQLKQDSPLLEMFIDQELTLEDNNINIEVSNRAEKMKLNAFKEQIETNFLNFGYGKVNLNIIINKAKAINLEDNNITHLIKQVSKKEENPIILGEEIKSKISTISNIIGEDNNITVEVNVFGIDYFESSKSNFRIITLKMTDYTDSLYCKVFVRDAYVYANMKKRLKEGNWYKIRGYVKNDEYSKELVLNARDIVEIKKESNEIIDNEKIKRVELHTHTFMSQMDGLIEPKKLIKEAKKRGYNAIAVTDHNGVQSFPDIYNTVLNINKGLKEGETPFKAIYGTELVMINDSVNIVIRPEERGLLESTYVVFDFETTGFNAGGGDSIIEVGAVKLLNGEIIDKFSELIDPKRPLPNKITEITGITDKMLKGKPTEETVIKKFMEWCCDLPMVAHNAKFDVSFLEMAYKKYNLGEFKNTVIDTLELSRTMDTSYARHSLSAIVKRYDVPFDENNHHRGDYDAEATALVFHKMMKKLADRNIEKISGLNKLVSQDEIHKFGRSYHINILAINREGLKNLFKIISLANTKYLYKTPRILRSEIIKHKEGLLIGSGCYESEIFIEARSKSDEELANLVKFYDYVEVQPPECYNHLLQMNDFANQNELLEHLKKIIRVSADAGSIVVATGDVHHLNRDDKIYREIIVNQKVPGGGRHPLSRNGINNIPSMHFRTTEEMLSDFSFLDKELTYEIVVTNTNKIADMIEMVEVIIDTKGVPFSPKIPNSVETVNELVYGKAKSIYGDPLPPLIDERIKGELTGIIKGGYDVVYLISQKLVKKSNDDGYIVGSRGSVGSSFVATMMGITEVNPLPAHYVCPKCKHTIFEKDGVVLGSIYSSGYDLSDFNCPKCNELMNKEGQDMPFATFLGFDADKVPDIDLNFSGEYQWKAHEYTKELFGIDNVYRAGTIGTVADKTAFGFVKGYCEDKNVIKRNAEVERLAMGCTGVKRTTGQHPGGIVVVPDYMEIFDFTPYQYPADDNSKLWRTTHFDYHSIEECLLKLDILGHDDPTTLRMLQDLTGVDVTKIDLTDQKVMQIFTGPEVLGVTKDQIMCETGTLGIPEMGTKFVIGMLTDTRPKTFSELLKISGLSHGTDVWLGNAQDLIKDGIIEFKDVIGCRDDIMVYLMYNGLEPKKAFKIMEFVRKGRPSKDPEGWKEHEQTMRDAKIPEWYIESCQKIKYMFPKAHAAAYVMSALRIAWFKVHMPIYYYCAYFSVRCSDFDIETMIKGYNSIKNKIVEINNKGYDASNKENAIVDVLYLALETTARGFKFGNIDLMKSDSMNFIIDEDMKTLIPPFRTLDGLGDTVAKKIVEERENGEFLSIEDLQKRGKVSGTIIDKMRVMGVLEGLDESSQLSLF